MGKAVFASCVWPCAVLLSLAGPAWAADAPAPGTQAVIANIAGTYELVKRVLSDGKEVVPPVITALYTLSNGRGNFNLFLKEEAGLLASESTISRYTLTASEYCEWIVFTVRNNLDEPGATNVVPPVAKHCTPVTVKDGRIVFEPPGEGVVVSFDKDGFTATAAGRFVDYWRKLP